MIGATSEAGGGFAQRLAERARRLAMAWVENRSLARTRDPLRWRRAALLWPNFTGHNLTGHNLTGHNLTGES